MIREEEFIDCLSKFSIDLMRCEMDGDITVKIPKYFYLHLKDYLSKRNTGLTPYGKYEIVFYGPNGKIKVESEN